MKKFMVGSLVVVFLVGCWMNPVIPEKVYVVKAAFNLEKSAQDLTGNGNIIQDVQQISSSGLKIDGVYNSSGSGVSSEVCRIKDFDINNFFIAADAVAEKFHYDYGVVPVLCLGGSSRVLCVGYNSDYEVVVQGNNCDESFDTGLKIEPGKRFSLYCSFDKTDNSVVIGVDKFKGKTWELPEGFAWNTSYNDMKDLFFVNFGTGREFKGEIKNLIVGDGFLSPENIEFIKQTVFK